MASPQQGTRERNARSPVRRMTTRMVSPMFDTAAELGVRDMTTRMTSSIFDIAAAVAPPSQQPDRSERSAMMGFSSPTADARSIRSPWAQPSSRNSSLEFDELQLEGAIFDPAQPALRAQLLQKMRMQPNALVEPMRGGIGSSNAGLWVLSDSAQSFVLKLVRSNPAFTESDKLAKLCRENPGIVADPSLSFPSKIFHCISNRAKTHDLVVMRQVPGIRVSELIMQKLHGKQVHELMRILEQFGSFLADFHRRYNGMQHGDLTPANVFYDECTGRFTLVDVADIAPRNPVIQSDTDRFSSSLKLLSTFYGQELFMQGKAQFDAGYNGRRTGHPTRQGSISMPIRMATSALM